jgi:hypothetical protein
MWVLIVVFTQFAGFPESAQVVSPVAIPGFTSRDKCEISAKEVRESNWRSKSRQVDLPRVVGIRTRCLEVR